jgi:hypothetical protein
MSRQRFARFDPFESGVAMGSVDAVPSSTADEKHATTALEFQGDSFLATGISYHAAETSSAPEDLPPETAFLEHEEQNQQPRVVKIPRPNPPATRFIPLQKWEGVVLRVMNEVFVARLIDQSHDGPDEEAEIPLEEIPEADKFLVKPGAVFYWTIGYSDSVGGQRTRVSVMVFRRLPAWTAEELTVARRKAQYTRELLGWS